jgi:glycosyltransferase involved in cell wall biosynthesis
MTKRRGRVLLAISGLSAGGSERVLTGLANHWSAQGRDVTIVTWSDPREDHYPLEPGIARLGLANPRPSRHPVDAVLNNLRRLRELRRSFRRSDVAAVISFGDSMNVLCLLAAVGTGKRVIVCIRNDPSAHAIGRYWALARRVAFPLAYRVVVQTDSVAAWASRIVGRSKVVVIPNAVTDRRCDRRDRDRAEKGSHILAIGRLVEQKGFDVLLDAFSMVTDRLPDSDLTLLGEGPWRERLQAQASMLGVADRVSLPGIVSDPERSMATSDLFVLSSRWEGFPNVLLEAMACGMAVVSTDCPSGPRDIVRDGHDGLLVPVDDARSMARAMAALLEDGHRRRELGMNARKVTERFSEERIAARWDALIASVSQA